jgi:dihydrofolate reductase
MNPFAAYPFFGVDSKKVLFFNSLDSALKQLYQNPNIENIFIIGGGMLYTEALKHPDCEELLVNRIKCDVECDTFFPEIDSNVFLMSASTRLDETVANERYLHRRHHSNTI